jgi:hypothetical protein
MNEVSPNGVFEVKITPLFSLDTITVASSSIGPLLDKVRVTKERAGAK